jgi:hypothetical protein
VGGSPEGVATDGAVPGDIPIDAHDRRSDSDRG